LPRSHTYAYSRAAQALAALYAATPTPDHGGGVMTGHHHRDIAPTKQMLVAALEYAALGWISFPVPVGTKKSHQKAKRDADKKVICARWDATNEPDQIRADRRAFGRSNIGVLTGPEYAFFVVDADTIAGGHAADGIASLVDLESKHGKLPVSLTARSPSGSMHYYFKYPLHIRVAPGIEAAKPRVLTIREQRVALIKIPENAFVRESSGDLSARRRAAWHATVFQKEVDRVANVATGERNAVLFQATAILGGYILGGADFTPDEAKVAMVAASKLNGSFDEDVEQQIGLTIRREMPDFTDNKSQGDNMVRLVMPASEETPDGAEENPDGADDDEPPGVSDTEFALADEFIAEHKADHRYFAAAPSEVQ
jgi:hypothetical protein